MKINILPAVILSFFLMLSNTTAETKNDIYRIEMDMVGLYNPLGLSFSGSAFYRHNYHLGESILWKDLYWQPGVQLAANPAYQRAGFHFEWVPAAILQMRVQYDRYHFSGEYGTLLAFDNTDGPFGDEEVEKREGDEQSGYGNRYLFDLTLRAKLGSIVISNVSKLMKYEFPGVGPYYLEREYELLMATTDYVFSNQFYILYESTNGKGKKSYLGPYYDYVQVRETQLERERLGVTYYSEYTKSWGLLEKPRWYFQGGVYLTERNRQDEIYMLLGVGGNFDF